MKPKIDSFELDTLTGIREPYAAMLDHYAGIDKMDPPPWNTSGAIISANTLLLRTSPVEPYGAYVKIGSKWAHLATVPLSDAGIAQLDAAGHITHTGPSPQEIEKRERLEAERKAREQAHEDYLARRRAEALRREQDAITRKREAVAARQ